MENRNIQFKANLRVKVIHTAHAPKERGGIIGKVGTFVEYTSNGYARVLINSESWMVHPENLEIAMTECSNQYCLDGWVDHEVGTQDGREGYVQQVPCQVCRLHCEERIICAVVGCGFYANDLSDCCASHG